MAKKVINTDIYNLAQLVKDVGRIYIPDETEETLSLGTYGYLNDIETHRLQTQVQMTGELANETFPSRARLERNVITHAINAGIEDINAVPHHMTVYIEIAENDIIDNLDSNNEFIIDRECPIYIGNYEFHLEYDIILKQIYLRDKEVNTYSARYSIPPKREVPNSRISTDGQYLSPPAVIIRNHEYFVLIAVEISQVTHSNLNKKLITANIIDNKIITFQFSEQLAYFEIEIDESDGLKYLYPVFEGASVPDNAYDYYCWYQYIDTNMVRVRFDRGSYMPGLNAKVNVLIKTTTGKGNGDIIYKNELGVTLNSDKYGYKNITAIITPLTNGTGGKNRKTKTELQKLIPKETLARGCITTISDLNNYFSSLDTEDGRIVVYPKINNQVEKVFYAYLIAKDPVNNVIPSNTIDLKIGLEDLTRFRMSESTSDRYVLSPGTCIKLGADGIGYINHDPLLATKEYFTANPVARGKKVTISFKAKVNSQIDNEKNIGVGATINGSNTPIYVYPADYNTYISESTIPIEVEDYMLLSSGQQYVFNAEYSTKESSNSIDIIAAQLECLTFISGYYTLGNDTTKYEITALPCRIDGLEANTKIKVSIICELNAQNNRTTNFTREGRTYVSPAGVTSFDIDEIASALGINSTIRGVTTSNDEIFSVLDETLGDWKVDLLVPYFDTTETITVRTDYGLYPMTLNQVDNILEYYIGIREFDETTAGVDDTTLIVQGHTEDNVMVIDDPEAYVSRKTMVLSAVETSVNFKCYLPSIKQVNRPEDLDVGDIVEYTVTYISPSALITPEVDFLLSKALDYVPFSTTISYEDGPTYSIEPTEIEISREGFVYTNPYAISINGYSLYAAFYMMSLEESHFFHFDWINQKSNVQFIASTLDWKRPFITNNKEYSIQFSIVQSVLEDLGVFDRDTGYPKVKAIIVFYRNGKPYRYRTMNIVDYSPTTYTVTFNQTFISTDTMDNDNNIKILGSQAPGQRESGVFKYQFSGNGFIKEYKTDGIDDSWELKEFLSMFGISISSYSQIESYRTSDSSVFEFVEVKNESTSSITMNLCLKKVFDTDQTLKFTVNGVSYTITATNEYLEYGYFNDITQTRIYVLAGVPDIDGVYSRYDLDGICPLEDDRNWTVTNVYTISNGLTMYNNYSEIMESRVTPYGTPLYDEFGNVTMDLDGYYVAGVPVLGYDYTRDETFAQYAINGLNSRKAYIDDILALLKNSFGMDFKLFNSYGPSKTFYIVRDTNKDKVLNDNKEYINRVDLSFYFRVKLVSDKDSYTVNNIIAEIKEYIEDLEDLGEIHIPNLVTQITNNYKEQVSYFEYLGFNSYGPEIQHIYKDDDSIIPIHVTPEFINVANIKDIEGKLVPNINIYISEI